MQSPNFNIVVNNVHDTILNFENLFNRFVFKLSDKLLTTKKLTEFFTLNLNLTSHILKKHKI